MSSRIMRVALNLEQLFQQPPGGVGRYAAALARVLATLAGPGDGVTVLPFVARHDPGEVVEVLGAAGVEHAATTIPYPRPLLYELWNRWDTLDPLAQPGTRTRRRVHGADVLHAPSVAVPPRNRVPLVVTVHDAAPLLFPETYPARGRRFHELGFIAAADRADAVVAPTAAAADEVATHTAIPRDRITAIHHGVDHAPATDDEVARVRSDTAIGAAPYVVWVGTLEPRKNLGTLIEAFARFVARVDAPHRLVLVGPSGWLAGAEDAAARAAVLGDRVVFTGGVRRDELRALYRGADVLALPSRHEGFGLAVVEAMAQGTPVLASDLPVLREVGGDVARYVPVGDVDAWTEALGALLGDDALRATLAAAGIAHARAFTWERSARAHLEVYRAVM